MYEHNHNDDFGKRFEPPKQGMKWMSNFEPHHILVATGLMLAVMFAGGSMVVAARADTATPIAIEDDPFGDRVKPTLVPPTTALETTTTVPRTTTTTSVPQSTTTTKPEVTDVSDTLTLPPTTTTIVNDVPRKAPPLVVWGWGVLGSWDGSNFEYAGTEVTDWSAGSDVHLVQASGATHDATLVECQGRLMLNPTPTPQDGQGNPVGRYWFTEGAPFTVSTTNDDSSLEAMNAALEFYHLDPNRAQSYGAPLAADGSADRLMWYYSDDGFIWWIATFDVETNTFTTIEGDPESDPGYEMGPPELAWVDLDRDGNLESMRFGGGDFVMTEWATGETVWSLYGNTCS